MQGRISVKRYLWKHNNYIQVQCSPFVSKNCFGIIILPPISHKVIMWIWWHHGIGVNFYILVDGFVDSRSNWYGHNLVFSRPDLISGPQCYSQWKLIKNQNIQNICDILGQLVAMLGKPKKWLANREFLRHLSNHLARSVRPGSHPATPKRCATTRNIGIKCKTKNTPKTPKLMFIEIHQI
jgi:hypothetical protein